MRRTVIVSTVAAAIGLLLIALPDTGSRLFDLSSEHGPAALDAAGAVLFTAGSWLVWWQVWRRRERLRSISRPGRFAVTAAAGLGAGLVTASVLSDFGAWWAVGAGLLGTIQIGLLAVVGLGRPPAPVRTRVTGYVTRTGSQGPELLLFDYLNEAGTATDTQLPGGGVEEGETLGSAMVREVVEETGVSGSLELRSVVGAQRSRYADTGRPYVNVFFHLVSDEPRDTWQHVMVGDAHAWDTGAQVTCRFVPIAQAQAELAAAGHGQDEFISLLEASGSPWPAVD